jgi:hypothetical protein
LFSFWGLIDPQPKRKHLLLLSPHPMPLSDHFPSFPYGPDKTPSDLYALWHCSPAPDHKDLNLSADTCEQIHFVLRSCFRSQHCKTTTECLGTGTSTPALHLRVCSFNRVSRSTDSCEIWGPRDGEHDNYCLL